MNIDKLKYYCNIVIPQIYSNALSYYEQICAIAKTVNDIIVELEKEKEDYKQYTDEQISILKTNLESQISELRSWAQTQFDSVNSKIESEVLKINNELSNLNTEVTGVMTSISNINNSLSTIQETLSTINNTVSNLIEKVNINKNDIATLKTSVSQLNTNIDTINTSLTNINSEINTLKDNVSDINDRIDTINANIETSKTEIDNLKNNVSSNTSAISSANSEISTLKSNQTTITQNVTTLTNELNSEKEIVDALGLAVQKNTSDIADIVAGGGSGESDITLDLWNDFSTTFTPLNTGYTVRPQAVDGGRVLLGSHKSTNGEEFVYSYFLNFFIDLSLQVSRLFLSQFGVVITDKENFFPTREQNTFFPTMHNVGTMLAQYIGRDVTNAQYVSIPLMITRNTDGNLWVKPIMDNIISSWETANNPQFTFNASFMMTSNVKL